MGDATDDPNVANKSKYAELYIGQSGPSIWREGMEVGNPIVDGLINDFSPIKPLVDHAISHVMRCNPSEHPILVTEPTWNTPANRERMAEIMFEEFNVPAFYIANTGVLNAFAAGKGTAFVVDVGQSMASVTPVVDGFVLRKGLVYSSLPRLVRANARHVLATPTQTRQGIALLPQQMIDSKAPVDPNMPPQFTVRQNRVTKTTESWKQWAEEREIDEWIQHCAAVLDQGWNDAAAQSRPPRSYEFPTGFNSYFGMERYQVGEQFFWHTPALVASNSNLPKNIPALITESLRACDAEFRQVFVSNVVLTGGGCQFSGFADRLNNELTRTFPHAKIHAPGNPIERRYGGWLGGSILASLGTFHQLWISKEEWQEHGKSIVGQRCK
ncbi:Actin-related protein 4 [Leucoagaricus sp. SymC.cos]|nr:Actin-related protein 4 [Leucoagaricus sp. SymC.cos]